MRVNLRVVLGRTAAPVLQEPQASRKQTADGAERERPRWSEHPADASHKRCPDE